MILRYKCSFCGEENTITSFWKWFWTPHLGNKKLLRCKYCGEKHYMARKDQKWSMFDWPKEKKK